MASLDPLPLDLPSSKKPVGRKLAVKKTKDLERNQRDFLQPWGFEAQSTPTAHNFLMSAILCISAVFLS